MKKTYEKQFDNKQQANAYYHKVCKNNNIRFATCSLVVDAKAWVVTYQFN